MHLVTEMREEEGLTTNWDNKLSHMLSPTLSNYEMERLGGK